MSNWIFFFLTFDSIGPTHRHFTIYSETIGETSATWSACLICMLSKWDMNCCLHFYIMWEEAHGKYLHIIEYIHWRWFHAWLPYKYKLKSGKWCIQLIKTHRFKCECSTHTHRCRREVYTSATTRQAERKKKKIYKMADICIFISEPQ